MTIQFNLANCETHFEQIIALQHHNLRQHLSPEQQATEGFVYAEHTVELLKQMAEQLPQIIALDEEKVIGYNLSMTATMADVLPSLTPMFEQFKQSTYLEKPLTEIPFIVGGQVCVDKAYRGQGLLKKLYHATKQSISPLYQLCVTEIARENTLSLKVHQNMGFQVIRSYTDGSTLWDIVAWSLK